MKFLKQTYLNRTYPIRLRLLMLVALPLCALIVALTYDTYQQYNNSLEQSYRSAAIIRAMSGAQTEKFLAQSKATLSQFAQRSKVKALDATQCDPVLSEFLRLQTAYLNVFTIDLNGKVLCSGLPIASDQLIKVDPQHYLDDIKRSGQFTIGKLQIDLISKRWTSTLALPIVDEHAQMIGIVGMSIDLVNYQPLISPKDLPAKTIIGIFNGEGNIVARSENAEQRVGRKANSYSVQQILEKKEGTIRANDYQNIGRIFSFAPIANSDWTIFIGLHEEEVFGPLKRFALIRLAFGAFIVLVVVFIAITLAKRIAQPVENISKTMALVAAGATQERATIEGPKEIAHIALQLNHMLDARHLAEEALRQSEARFHTAFDTSPDAIAITSLADGRYIEVNPAFSTLTGWSAQQVIGKTALELNVWQFPAEREKFVKSLLQDGQCTNLEAQFLNMDGRSWTGLVSAHLMEVERTTCILSIIKDITAIKAAADQIHSLSFLDGLTKLPNRRLLMDRTIQAITACARHHHCGAIMYIDLDDFKSINETISYEQGDAFLIEMARRLKSCVREADTVARIGADEFVLVLEHLSTNLTESAAQAELIGDKILETVQENFMLAGNLQSRSCSIGVTLFCDQFVDAQEALKRAELAMHRAKSAGRNTMCFFDPQMQAEVSARTKLERDLKTAIAQHQILLHYQPQVANNGSTVGVEALVRWHEPERGLISPAAFIPLAEESGLILPLGQRVIEIACTQLATWANQAKFSHLSISVNVSAKQFHQADFVSQVRHVLQKSKANPHKLKLEITESMLVSDIEQVIAKMNELKSIGVGFSMDDFGTGYSSLSYLKRLPLDQLKIDQSFVRDILVDANDAAIAKMVIALAESMGLVVIAEGVETQAQREKLQALGCSHFQGYLFSKPLPIDQLEKNYFKI